MGNPSSLLPIFSSEPLLLPPDSISTFSVSREPENMCGGRFHTHLRDSFAPQVVRYIDLMESSITQSLYKGFEREKWEARR